MTEEEKRKVDILCYRSKKGYTPSEQEHGFLQTMFSQYPEEYRIVQKEAASRAMNEVNPFK